MLFAKQSCPCYWGKNDFRVFFVENKAGGKRGGKRGGQGGSKGEANGGVVRGAKRPKAHVDIRVIPPVFSPLNLSGQPPYFFRGNPWGWPPKFRGLKKRGKNVYINRVLGLFVPFIFTKTPKPFLPP